MEDSGIMTNTITLPYNKIQVCPLLGSSVHFLFLPKGLHWWSTMHLHSFQCYLVNKFRIYHMESIQRWRYFSGVPLPLKNTNKELAECTHSDNAIRQRQIACGACWVLSSISLLNSYPVLHISLYDFKVPFNAEHNTVGRFSLARHNFKIWMHEIRGRTYTPSKMDPFTLSSQNVTQNGKRVRKIRF